MAGLHGVEIAQMIVAFLASGATIEVAQEEVQLTVLQEPCKG